MDAGDRRQHVHGLFIGKGHRLLFEFGKVLVANFGIAPGGHLRADREHGRRRSDVGGHAAEHRGSFVSA